MREKRRKGNQETLIKKTLHLLQGNRNIYCSAHSHNVSTSTF